MKSGRRSVPVDSKKRPIIYWDTCVLLAWMQNEKRGAGEMEALDEVSQLIRKDKVVLVTSTLTRAEILKGKVSKAAMDKMTKLFRRPNVVPLILDTPVSVLTSEIRDFYNPTDFELLTPDAIHLATAIHHKVTEFHTFDGCNATRKPRNPSKTRCGLILLDGNVAGHSLRVRKPSAEQLSLLTNIESVQVGIDEQQDNRQTEQGNQPSTAEVRGSDTGRTESEASFKAGPTETKTDGKKKQRK